MSTIATPRPAHAEGEIVLPEAKMHLYRPNEPVLATLIKSEICTSKKAAGFVRHVEFDVTGTKLAGNVLPGQSIGVIAPGNDEKGRPHAVRLYSVSNPTCGEDGQGNILSTSVKRVIDENWENHKLFTGVCSNYICDIQVGEQVKLSGPNGKKFLLPADQSAHDYLFFATGTGVAPFRGMVLDLLKSKAKSKIVFVMGSPFSVDLIYDDLFRKLAAENPNFTYLTAISREKQEDGNGRLYVQDRITTHKDMMMPLLSSERTLIYICGIAGMEVGILQHMAQHLSPGTLEQYVHADKEAMADIKGWNKKMMNRQIKPTKRMFLEVYA
jgi:ferredoxin--NADP+ reductase